MALTKIKSHSVAVNSLTVANIADNAIDATKIASNSILTRHIDDAQITTDQILDGTIATADIADDAVTSAKLDTNIDIAGTLGVTGNITGTLATAAQPNITSLGTLTGLTSTGNLVIGTEDNNAAIIEISGGATGSDEGGEIRLDTAADYDSTYEFYRLDVSQDDFRIGRAGQTDLTINSLGNAIFGGTINSGRITTSDGIADTGQAGSATIFNESGSTADFRIESDSKPYMFFLDGGLNRIGINTGTPTHTLHILNEVSSDTIDETNGLVKMQSSGGNGMIFGTIASSPYTSYIQSAYVVDTSLAQYNLALNPLGGNVGIGTDSPDYALDVYDVGEAWIRADSSTTTESTANSGLRFAHGGVNHGVLYHRGSDDALLYFDNIAASTRFLIDSSGKVGIGADSPLALLHINGTGDAIRVTSTNTGQGGAQMDLLHYTSSPADGDIPGVINFGGYYSGTASAYSAAIRSVWSNAGGREGQLQFITRQSGSQFDTQLTINHLGHMHLGHDKASVQFYVGNQGGIMGGNASHNVRGAGNLFMLNAGGTNGSYIFETNGTARLTIANDGVSLASAAPSADSYTHKFRSSNSADPGILLYREGQCGLGITVRNATVDYASFLVGSSGDSTSYDTEAGTTNVPLRIYQNGNVCLGRGEHVYNSNDGHIFYSTGRWSSTFNYNSTGAEIYIQNNRTASGTVAAFQYRINNSPQSGGTIYASTSGYTGGNFSDYRLKNNVTNLTGSLDKINQLRAVSYKHVNTPDKTELGFIAHEINEVFPEFVHGEKDAVWTQEDIDNYEGQLPEVEVGDIKAQQVDYFSKEWTTHILQAIKELKAENDSLKARIETLEG